MLSTPSQAGKEPKAKKLHIWSQNNVSPKEWKSYTNGNQYIIIWLSTSNNHNRKRSTMLKRLFRRKLSPDQIGALLFDCLKICVKGDINFIREWKDMDFHQMMLKDFNKTKSILQCFYMSMLTKLAHYFFEDKGREGNLIFLRHVASEKPKKTVEEWVDIIDNTVRDYGMGDRIPFPLYDVSKVICRKEWGTTDEYHIGTFAAKVAGGYEAFFFCFNDALKGSKLAEQMKIHFRTEMDEISDRKHKRYLKEMESLFERGEHEQG